MDLNEQLKGWLQQQAQPGSFLDKAGLGLAQAGQTIGQDAAAGAAIMNDPRNSWIGMNPVGRMAAGGLGLAGALGQVAYHGSPHLFEKFAMSKLGTGEGHQAFGHGLYFAENPKVAEQYAKQLVTKENPIGTMYKVDIPDEAVGKMLHLDEPLSKQPPDVQEAVKKATSEYMDMVKVGRYGNMNEWALWNDDTGYPLYRSPLFKTEEEATAALQDPTGSLVRNILEDFVRPDEATSLLKKHGIPGIKYLDGMSREAGKGTSNYVVFDDQLPQIKEWTTGLGLIRGTP